MALIERRGHVIDKEELMQRVWPDTFVEEGNLAQNIYTLRKMLGETPEGADYIKTVPRRGYRFAGAASGRDRVDAERSFFSVWLSQQERAAHMPPAIPEPRRNVEGRARPPRGEGEEVIGLFPSP